MPLEMSALLQEVNLLQFSWDSCVFTKPRPRKTCPQLFPRRIPWFCHVLADRGRTIFDSLGWVPQSHHQITRYFLWDNQFPTHLEHLDLSSQQMCSRNVKVFDNVFKLKERHFWFSSWHSLTMTPI